MDVKQMLLSAGFARVLALNAADCDAGRADQTLLLAFWPYAAEAQPNGQGAWIHPYYYASQSAYRAAVDAVRQAKEQQTLLTLRDEIRVKPLFARLAGFAQGRNTLSYTEDWGSRFHVQIFLLDEALPLDAQLQAQPHPLQCGDCTRCLSACPTGAIDQAGFHRERCLRNWMMSGKPVPEDLRPFMGNRLIGCDDCQRCCPHQPKPVAKAHDPLPLSLLLTDPKGSAKTLSEIIGTNLSLPNRVLAQACLLVGCSGDTGLLDRTEALQTHPSDAVRVHAAWAAEQLRSIAEQERK